MSHCLCLYYQARVHRSIDILPDVLLRLDVIRHSQGRLRLCVPISKCDWLSHHAQQLHKTWHIWLVLICIMHLSIVWPRGWCVTCLMCVRFYYTMTHICGKTMTNFRLPMTVPRSKLWRTSCWFWLSFWRTFDMVEMIQNVFFLICDRGLISFPGTSTRLLLQYRSPTCTVHGTMFSVF